MVIHRASTLLWQKGCKSGNCVPNHRPLLQGEGRWFGGTLVSGVSAARSHSWQKRCKSGNCMPNHHPLRHARVVLVQLPDGEPLSQPKSGRFPPGGSVTLPARKPVILVSPPTGFHPVVLCNYPGGSRNYQKVPFQEPGGSAR